MIPFVLIVVAYLLGSLSFAVITSKLWGLADPRTYGSKNPGATNMLRSGNRGAALATLFGDCFKGWLAVWLAIHLAGRFDYGDGTIAAVALAVFCGHLWPVFFRFAGGKGVATALGILLALNLWLGLGTLLTWIIIAYAFRYSSLAALIAAVFAPFFYALMLEMDPIFLAILFMSLLLIWRHASNIGNLISGKETRLGSKR